jgi:hypothetical protein
VKPLAVRVLSESMTFQMPVDKIEMTFLWWCNWDYNLRKFPQGHEIWFQSSFWESSFFWGLNGQRKFELMASLAAFQVLFLWHFRVYTSVNESWSTIFSSVKSSPGPEYSSGK